MLGELTLLDFADEGALLVWSALNEDSSLGLVALSEVSSVPFREYSAAYEFRYRDSPVDFHGITTLTRCFT